MSAQTHVNLPGSKRPVPPHATRVGDIDPNQKFAVTLNLAGPRLPGPDEYVGQTLTPEEVQSRFSASKEDADKVAKSLRKFGLKVDSVSLPTRSMVVSGTAAGMQAAFKADLSIMCTPEQGEYRGRSGTLQIPAELKGIVTGVFGLDQRRVARRKAMPVPVRAAGAHSPLTPSDVESRYNFPQGDCAGQVVAIAEFGGGYFDTDLAAYCRQFQRQVPTVNAIGLDAPAYTLQQIQALPKKQRATQLEMSIEVMMDIQIVAGLCANAEIDVYFTSFDERGWVDLLNAVITKKPCAVSISWGMPEDHPSWSKGAQAAINDRLNAARLLGITVCVSSGDDGSGDEMADGAAHVDFPASSPFVLGVGGTMLKGSKEVTWWESPGRRTNSGGGATGGGVSVLFPRPAWQTAKVESLNKGSIDGRVVPDISALAGSPFYSLIFLGQQQPNGGTSASAPVLAALIARINANLPGAKQQRFLAPLLYQNGAGGKPVGKIGTKDITSGNNASNPSPGKGYHAGAGYDAVTGWGVPDGVKLQNALESV